MRRRVHPGEETRGPVDRAASQLEESAAGFDATSARSSAPNRGTDAMRNPIASVSARMASSAVGWL